MKIITLKEAKEKKLKTYFTGKPCKHGHITKRLTATRTCCECIPAIKAKYRKENREKVFAYSKEWRKDNLEYFKKHRQTNRAVYNAYAAKRHASKMQRTPAWANQKEITMWYEVAEVLSRSGVKFHVDHVVPMQGKNVSGLHVSENMQVLPASLNISKHNQWNWETQSHE
jgi:hypothetical protein